MEMPRMLWWVAGGMLLCGTASGKDWHTGYWKARLSDTGEVRKCVVVKSEGVLEHVLREVGWEGSDGELPGTDWDRNEAIVVAAEKNDKGYPGFFGIVKERGRLVLRYGWKKISGVTRHSSGSISIGSSAPPSRSALVVFLGKGFVADQDLRCRNLGLVK